MILIVITGYHETRLSTSNCSTSSQQGSTHRSGWVGRSPIDCEFEAIFHVITLNSTISQIEPLQTNGYDCGVWILAVIIAVLRRREIMGLREDEMSDLRYYLYARVLSIPVD